MVVFLDPKLVNEVTVGGNRLVRVRVEHVIEGRAVLGGYHYSEIADVHLLGPSTAGMYIEDEP